MLLSQTVSTASDIFSMGVVLQEVRRISDCCGIMSAFDVLLDAFRKQCQFFYLQSNASKIGIAVGQSCYKPDAWEASSAQAAGMAVLAAADCLILIHQHHFQPSFPILQMVTRQAPASPGVSNPKP